jgi:flagellar hook assembly protein FlgD
MKGQLVKTLVNEHQEANKYNVIWNGENESHKPVSSGVYLYKLRTDNFTQTKKMLMLK